MTDIAIQDALGNSTTETCSCAISFGEPQLVTETFSADLEMVVIYEVCSHCGAKRCEGVTSLASN